MADRTRLRKGTLGGHDIYLAAWKEQPYLRLYREILPDRVDIPGEAGKIEGDPTVRSWSINDWSGGLGFPYWEQGVAGYNDAAGLRPTLRGVPGLTCGPEEETGFVTPSGTLSPRVFFTLNGFLYTASDVTDDYYKKSVITSNAWTAESITPAGTGTAISAAVVGSNAYIATTNEEILEWDGTNPTIHYATGTFTEDLVLAAYGGILYALDPSGLYTVSTTATNTRTQVVDHIVDVNRLDPDTDGPIMVATDNGVQWLQDAGDGRVVIHEYNHWTEAHSVIAVVPASVGGTTVLEPTIGSAFGFTWVAYKEYLDTADEQVGWLYFKGGGQEGLIGPLSDVTTGGVAIAGAKGDDLLWFCGGVLYAYNVTFGGVHRVSRVSDIGAQHATTFRQQVIAANGTTATHFSYPDSEDGEWHTLDTGRFDFGYPGFAKIFTEVNVYVESASGQTGDLGLAYAVDGGVVTTHATEHAVDAGDFIHTFTLSDSSTTVKGHELELRLRLKSDGATGPIIRKVVPRGLPAEASQEIILELDTTGPTAEGTQPRSADLLANLKSIATSGDVISFSNPWEVEEHEAAVATDVKVVQVVLPPEGSESREQGVATVRLREV